MKCACGSERLCVVQAKCSDMFSAQVGEAEYDGYVPDDLGISDGDYVEFTYCLDCGKIQGTWPLPETEMEKQAAREHADDLDQQDLDENRDQNERGRK